LKKNYQPPVFPKFPDNAMSCDSTARIEMMGDAEHKQTIATRPVWVFAQMYFAAQLALREKEPPPPASRPVPECFRFVANFGSRGWGNQQSTVWY